MNNGGGVGGAAPTGCYKCGRPGHWSRDCPSNPITNTNTNTDNPKISSSNIYSKNTSSSSLFKSSGGASSPTSEKPKKVPRARPKLTPDLLLSNDGLGYVLRHFPHAFRYRGRRHEVSDLGNLIGLYAEWHSHLLPYYSFEQFVHKVEQVGATKRVRLCVKELRERVANGGDLTKLHEPPVEQDISNHEQVISLSAAAETLDLEEGTSLKNHDTDDLQEDMLQEIYKQATEEPYTAMHDDTFAAKSSDNSTVKELPNQAPESAAASSSSPIHISEEQRARMEANRLKALERATAAPRSGSLQAA